MSQARGVRKRKTFALKTSTQGSPKFNGPPAKKRLVKVMRDSGCRIWGFDPSGIRSQISCSKSLSMYMGISGLALL